MSSEPSPQKTASKIHSSLCAPNEKSILLASPRGFCAGVDRAIEIVERSLQIFSPPLYVNHEIVHNRHVVNRLQEKGVIFTEDLEAIPAGETVIFSAHGVSPALWQKAKKKKLRVIDATCPLVTKVHLGVHRFVKAGCHIIYIGHKKHVETIGTIGEAPDNITIVETIADAQALQFPAHTKLAYLTQTTLSLMETQKIVHLLQKKFPQIQGPLKNDICYATTNRQRAVAAMAPLVNLFLVIGSQNSSNSNRLREVAEQNGCTAYLIDDERFIRKEWFSDEVSCIGLTAGASAPEILVEHVINHLRHEYGFSKVHSHTEIEEHISFQLPTDIRNGKS